MAKLKLEGFNNLTKTLSFNIYDVCYADTPLQRQQYIEYIDEVYNAERLTQILTDVCNIIGATILNIAHQDYDPQGASATILIAEEEFPLADLPNTATPGPFPEAVVAHLDGERVLGTLGDWDDMLADYTREQNKFDDTHGLDTPGDLGG